MRTTAEDYQRTAAWLNDIGKQLHAKGFSLGYHNHDFEFTKFDGKTGFDILFENTDANHLKIELDCFWAAYTGNNPVDIIENYADRCVSLHVKDMKVGGDQHISTELGTGTLPLADYIQQGKKHSVRWFVVEQEHFTKDPVESAAQNATAIRAIFEK
ncbi:sugar phosphate isomerase/epimerase family protein [Sporosarcina sp. NPDC096371]|uniref:sugar phosphate isomerase/epimerase family protein n=1 Tax=Sporosarcina sp. NPDC096371 TaxID=3364530 RepID=UPI00380B041C